MATAFTLLATGCSVPTIKVRHDSEAQRTTASIDHTYTLANEKQIGSSGQIRFGFDVDQYANGADSMWIVVAALVRNGLIIRQGDTLTLTADAAIDRVVCLRPDTERDSMQLDQAAGVRGAYLFETAHFLAGRDVMAHIAYASRVAYSISGRNGIVEGELPERLLQKVRLLYKDHIF